MNTDPAAQPGQPFQLPAVLEVNTRSPVLTEAVRTADDMVKGVEPVEVKFLDLQIVQVGREGIEPPMPKQLVYSQPEPPGSSDPSPARHDRPGRVQPPLDA